MKRVLVALIIITMLTITNTVARSEDVSSVKKHFGGTLVWGTHTKPTMINPLFTRFSVSASLIDLLFNRLVRINSRGEIEPDLAKSWEISEDGLVYTFYLKKGVKFHDGQECRAEDVEFTYNMLMDPEVNSPHRSSFEMVRDFKTIDRYTFQIILKKPSGFFIYRLAREIVPKHLLDKTNVKVSSFNFHPVGTGPFKFKEWTKDDRITLEYNPDYYEGRPYLDRIVVKTYPDSKELWTALMRKEVDLVLFIEKEDYEIVKIDTAFKSYAVPIDHYYALCYNLDDPILSDIRVRKAIAHSIDRGELINIVADGYGVECNGPFYPGYLGFNPDIDSFKYNPEKAEKLLDECGWLDQDKDRIRKKAGETLKIKVLVDQRYAIFKRIAMVIRQQLQEIGVVVKVVLYDDERMVIEEFIEQHNAQAHLRLFFAGDPENIMHNWGPKEIKGVDKIWIYENVKVNKLFEETKIEPNETKRDQIFQEIHKLVYSYQPACFLYFICDFNIISARFKNTDEFFTPGMPFYTMKDWYFSEDN